MSAGARRHSLAGMFKRIVVGYAGDRAGRDGALLASRLASLSGAALTVTYPYHPLFAEVPCSVAEQRAREELEAMLGPHAGLEQARFRWSGASWPIRALHELAEFEAADLIVFGAAPERLGRRHVDLMERMVHGAPCAVAVAPERYVEDERSAIERVGVGFLDTREGRAAAAMAAELARIAGEPLTIVSGSGLTGALAGYAAMSPALPEAERDMHEQAQAAAEQIAAELDGRVSVQVRRGDPARVLVEATRTLDLLVLGSRGYGLVRHVLLGGVSAEVMHRAHCPVLVLPRTSTRADAGPLQRSALDGERRAKACA